MVSKKSRHRDPLIIRTPQGLYCPKARAHIDPWRPVDCALITHAHADHARAGSKHYHCALGGEGLLEKRLGPQIIDAHRYGEPFVLGDVQISFHPAGHVLGSAQIRIDDGDTVWVITGDYKRDPDPTCQRFEPMHCDVLITEATFALPIYRWPSMDQVMEHMFRWWDHHIRNQRTPILLCYSLGKAQRIMAEIRQRSDRSVRVHGAVANLNLEYEKQGVALCPWQRASESDKGVSTDLIIAPPQVAGSSFLKRFHPTELAMASGWMQVRGVRRRSAINHGFVVSDHADWQSLIQTIQQSKARQIYATHGETRVLTRYLTDHMGVAADRLETAFGIEQGADQ
ncbi:MAG: ligase-associated DNA damage response exonuclease [Pseudomonadota bacterium]|nr:ligase-associated DNA damage response exonuclease [Pseudomonadota bacterium]